MIFLPFFSPFLNLKTNPKRVILCVNLRTKCPLNKFKIKDILGRVIIIHDMPDDFTTQPSGNSGTKIACGKIER